MSEKKSKALLILLIASILLILLAFIPQFISLTDFDEGELLIRWLMGFFIDFDNGAFDQAGFINFPPLIIIGAPTTVLMVIIGIFLLVTVIFTKVTNKRIPFIGLILLLVGIIVLLLPIFTRLGFVMVLIIRDTDLFWLFSYHIDLYTTITPIIGLLIIASGILELK